MELYYYKIINTKTKKFVSPLLFKFSDLTTWRFKKYSRPRRIWNTKQGRHIDAEKKKLDIVEFKLIETGVSVPIVDNEDFTKLLMETFKKE